MLGSILRREEWFAVDVECRLEGRRIRNRRGRTRYTWLKDRDV
jgi:hypothetical protein